MSGDVCVKIIIRLKMGFDPIVTGDRRRAAVHRMKIPFCRRSRLQEIRFRPASGSERQASAPLSNLDSSGLVETLVLAHSSKTDRGNLVYTVRHCPISCSLQQVRRKPTSFPIYAANFPLRLYTSTVALHRMY